MTSTTVPILRGYRRYEYLAGATIWLATLVYFWVWWLKPEHFVGFWGFSGLVAISARSGSERWRGSRREDSPAR